MKRGEHQKTPECKSTPRSIGTMNLILVIVGVLLIVFTGEMIHLFKLQGAIPDTLCTCVFACLGGECGIMGWIKTTKERRKEREWEQEDKRQAEAAAKAAATPEDEYESTISRR